MSQLHGLSPSSRAEKEHHANQSSVHTKLCCRGVVGPQSWQLLGLSFDSDQHGTHCAHLSCIINSSQVASIPSCCRYCMPCCSLAGPVLPPRTHYVLPKADCHSMHLLHCLESCTECILPKTSLSWGKTGPSHTQLRPAHVLVPIYVITSCKSLSWVCAQAGAQQLTVQALVCTPAMQIEPGGSLFFKPTCIGASSQRTLTMHNTSRVPLQYQVALTNCLCTVRFHSAFHCGSTALLKQSCLPS